MAKRLNALLMVCILALSMSLNVSAASATTVITVTCSLPEINVIVSSTGVYINPKNLSVEGTVENSQIINEPWSIENQSVVPLQIDAEVTATINSNSSMKLAAESVASSTSSDKLAFMFLDMKVTDPGTDLSTLDWDSTVYDPEQQILVTESGIERSNIMTLAAGNADGTTAAGGVGAFHISGDATPTPADAWDSSKDIVTVNIAFTFTPVSYSES